MIDKQYITAYVTKYWETRGVVEALGYIGSYNIFHSKSLHTGLGMENYFLSKEEAIKRVEALRKKKLISLKKRYDRIEKMIFQ